MKNFRYIWLVGLITTLAIVITPIVLLVSRQNDPSDDPWVFVPERPPETDHSDLVSGPFETGQEVTVACLECHEEAGEQVMHTSHFTWLSEPVEVAGHDEPVQTGKANSLNNFCIGVQSNESGCSRCHAGYGYTDSTYFDTASEENVDCLVCHDTSGTYVKAAAGLPAEGVDLEMVAQSVGTPSRETCGGCHFNGGGGNGVKHGDLDETLYYPTEEIDVHMGRLDFTCVDCHQTEDHQIQGRSISVSPNATINQVACTDCHNQTLHEDDRINAHTDTVACQTCHIPEGAVRDATKMHWDWSTAGDPTREENEHEYLMIKGSFVYEDNFMPSYMWFNGTADRYILGDPMDPNEVTPINQPYGDLHDPTAMIWPFKIHYANQPYDSLLNILLQPQTVGPTGYWTTFDWNSALAQGSAAAGIPYSGEYGFAPTSMYWPLAHMVQPKEDALQCVACHTDNGNGRLDWEALGYPGDPMFWGGRDSLMTSESGGQ